MLSFYYKIFSFQIRLRLFLETKEVEKKNILRSFKFNDLIYAALLSNEVASGFGAWSISKMQLEGENPEENENNPVCPV